MRRRVNIWDFSPIKDTEAGYIFAARFSNDGNFVIAGGAGKNELRIFANNVDSSRSFKPLMEITGLPCPVYCIDRNPSTK